MLPCLARISLVIVPGVGKECRGATRAQTCAHQRRLQGAGLLRARKYLLGRSCSSKPARTTQIKRRQSKDCCTPTATINHSLIGTPALSLVALPSCDQRRLRYATVRVRRATALFVFVAAWCSYLRHNQHRGDNRVTCTLQQHLQTKTLWFHQDGWLLHGYDAESGGRASAQGRW
eukprot:SAG11_NODE_507_length_8879_cov_8.961048_11_plen_175_part_00